MRISISVGTVGLAAAGQAGAATSISLTPTYSRTQGDCTATGSRNGWSIGQGCDNYQQEIYERPTTQTYKVRGGELTASTYFQNLDIEEAKAGADNKYLYLSMEMVGTAYQDRGKNPIEQGLIYDYVILLSNVSDGAFGHMIRAETPGTAAGKNGVFSTEKVFGFVDANGSVGGRAADGSADGLFTTRTDSSAFSDGNRFETDLIADGHFKDGSKAPVAFARLQPGAFGAINKQIVEFAIDYTLLGYAASDIANILAGRGYLDFRAIKGGEKDKQNFLWNDKNTFADAGTPYSTVGLKNVYESDTVRLALMTTAVPEPATWLMLIGGFGLVGGALRRHNGRLQPRSA